MTDHETISDCLRQINPAALEYDEWLAVGMAMKDAGLSVQQWDAWSATDRARYKPNELRGKWNSFKRGEGVGIGTLVKLCRDQGGNVDTGRAPDRIDHQELSWDAAIGPREGKSELQVVRPEWLEDAPLPPEPDGKWNGLADFANYIRVLFNSDERVGYVVESYESDPDQDGKTRWLPKRGVWDRTAGDILETCACANDLGEVLGDWPEKAGAWIRFNPLDGNGCHDTNVAAYRYALVESDEISVERQHAIYRKLELPTAALVHSGSKSLHAIVKIEAPDYKEYIKRVDFLYDVCKKNGLVIDRKNRNPSRLSRLPGATRDGAKQWLVATNIGQPTWGEWADWIAAVNDDLPKVENAAEFIRNPPPLPEAIIEDVLREGHKLMLAGPSKGGKSFLLLQLAIAVAEGGQWMGWKCKKGRVLYVNLELARESCYHRLHDLYEILNIQEPNFAGDIDVWNLRGKAMGMDHLAPKLIRRAAKRQYSLIIIDPIYKVITGDENAADQMAKFCNQFDRVCHELGCAVVYCHHHSKGSQGQKRASDRSSGSGVFARDPDALIDLIELEIDEFRRKQISNRWEADAMSQALDQAAPAWRDQCSQDDASVADKLAKWAVANNLGDVIRDPRSLAVTQAERASAWKIEGILREFESFVPRRSFFRYPVHVPDTHGLIADALAEGEIDHKRREKSIQDKQTVIDSEMEMAYETLKTENDEVTVIMMAEALNVDKDTIWDRIKKGAKRGGKLRFKKGVVFENEQ